MNKLNFPKQARTSITYLGGIGENLTGSSKLLTIKIGAKVHRILVDAGSRQGGPDQDVFNTNIPIDLKKLSHILITHAHMDHIGKLGLYVKNGFEGKIIMTPLTKLLMYEALKDEQKILQKILDEKKEIVQKLKRAMNQVSHKKLASREGGPKITKNNKGEGIKNPERLLSRYNINSHTDIKREEHEIKELELSHTTQQDLWQILALCETYEYGENIKLIGERVSAKLLPAGHIEGSAQISMNIDGKKALFSGDLGRITDNVIIGKPTIPTEAYDFISLESTYGGKNHPKRSAAKAELYHEIRNSHKAVILPCFSLQRIPEILITLLDGLVEGSLQERQKTNSEDEKPQREFGKIYVDSPLGKKYIEIFLQELLVGKSLKYKKLVTDKVHYVQLAERQHLIEKINKGHRLILISSSGMLQGGTIMSYLPHVLSNPHASLIFTGYPGNDTLARRLIDQREKKVYVQGQPTDVVCRTKYIEGFSGHADHGDLMKYFKDIKKSRHAKVALEHGGEQRFALQKSIRNMHNLNVTTHIPSENETINL